MSRWNLAWLLGIPAVALLGLTLSYSAPPPSKDKDYEFVSLLIEVLDKVDRDYVRELDENAKRKLIEDMINGGLDHLDPHSNYMNAKEYKQFNSQSKGKFGGIGIKIGVDRQTGQIQVESPIVGTPAYEAGVMAGDIIVKIDGKSTENMRLNEAVDLIQGDKGEKITLTVVHLGSREPVDLSMERDLIEVETIMGDLRQPTNPKEWEWFIDKQRKIGYVRVLAFNENTTADLRKAVEQMKKDGVKGLVIDLRGNPGGLLQSSYEVSNFFVPEGKIVSTKGRNQKEKVYEAKPDHVILPSAKDVPLVVLVNKYSASASEIVSACLQDHNRAVIVGERSYGKGSVQNILKLDTDGSALKLTTASYMRPSGKNIHRFPDSKESDEWGVKPNEGFEVPLKDEEKLDYAVYRRERDVVPGKPGTPPQPPKVKKDKDGNDKKPFVDRVLEKGLEYLRQQIDKGAGAGLPLEVVPT